jgi:hypothetical protein
MGTGTDVAISTADITVMRPALMGVIDALDLSKRTLSTIKGNLTWAFAYNVVMIPMAAGIFFLITVKTFPPMYGSAAMGFYATAAERTPLLTVRLLADLPAQQRPDLQEVISASRSGHGREVNDAGHGG